MDPDCAICRAPAEAACDCEAKGLEVAVKQAEEKVMLSIYEEIRTWVRSRAQDHILEHFRQLTERRKKQHQDRLEQVHDQAFARYGAPPHPRTLEDAEMELKHGIDGDWRASVHRYPEVLEHFFNLVELSLPADGDPALRNPPTSAGAVVPRGKPPSNRRNNSYKNDFHHEPPYLPSVDTGLGLYAPPRTPPPERQQRRGHGGRKDRTMRYSQPPPPQHAPYAPYQRDHAPYMG